MQLATDKSANCDGLSPEEFNDIMAALNMGAPKYIAVATSGGGDSLALCLLLKKWCDNHNIDLIALTVDHALRDASKSEADQVATWMADYNINHEILSWIGDKPDSNISDISRKARYKLMGDYCTGNEITHLFLGHHKQDQAETFLLRLFRGSGIDGLSAMEKVGDFPFTNNIMNSLKICRPLLDISKERLLGTLKEMDQQWIEDPSNEDLTYSRIQVRSLINNSTIDGLNSDRLAATAGRMRRVRSLLEALTNDAEQDNVTYDEFGVGRLKPDFYINLHEEISLRLLSGIIKKVSGSDYGPRLSKLETLYQKLKNNQFNGQTILGAILFKANNNDIIFMRQSSLINDVITITDQQQVLWDNRFILSFKEFKGKIQKIDGECLDKTNKEMPEFKDHMKLAFEDHNIRGRLLATLPCLVLDNGNVRLANILSDKITAAKLTGFSAVLKE